MSIEVNKILILEVKQQARSRRPFALSMAIAVSVVAHIALLVFVSVQPVAIPYVTPSISIRLLPHEPDFAAAEAPTGLPASMPAPDPDRTQAMPEILRVNETVGSADEGLISRNLTAADDRVDVQIESPVMLAGGASEPAAMIESNDQPVAGAAVTGTRNWEDGVRLDLMNWLERHKRYPIAARRKGVQGAVLVRFVVSSEGVLLEKELLESSGSKHLDSAAMKLLSRAAPYPKLPEQLMADVLEVRLPIEYRLVVGRHRT